MILILHVKIQLVIFLGYFQLILSNMTAPKTTVLMQAHFNLYQGRKCDHFQVACNRISNPRASRESTFQGFDEASLLTAVTPRVSVHSRGNSSHSHQTGHHCRHSEEHLMPAVKIYSTSFVCASVKITDSRKTLKL